MAAQASAIAREHLAEFADAHAYASRVHRTPFPGDWMVADEAREHAVEGITRVIEAGNEREAMYPLLQRRCWVQAAIDNDAPEPERTTYSGRARELMCALGYCSASDLEQKLADAESLFPEVVTVARQIAQRAAT